MSDNSNGLSTPWIVVIVLAVLLTGETVYLIMVVRRNRGYGGGGVRRRGDARRTEWFELSSARNQPTRNTGFSPIEPPAARYRY